MERIQKLMSQAGIASRRKAEELIIAGKVIVNGKVAKLGDKGTFEDIILVNGKAMTKEEHVYWMINKPEKTICSLNDPQGRVIITDLIKENKKIFPVGRLDFNTTGILLLTNDGELSNRLTHPSYEVVRVYRARIQRALTPKQLNFLNSNDVFLDEKQSKQIVEKVDTKTYIVSLTVGTYHHVKKLFELVENEVISLTRIEFAGLTHVGKLSKGQSRRLTTKEINWLKHLVKLKK